MKKAMRKYRLNVKGRIDRVLLGRVWVFLGGGKSFGGEMEGGWGSADGSVEEETSAMTTALPTNLSIMETKD